MRRRGTWTAIAWPPLVLVLPASGCGCDSIGCFNGVVIRIDEQFDLSALPIEITTCVNDECAVELVEASQLVPGSTTPMPFTWCQRALE